MGSLSMRARRARGERVAAGLPPYEVREGSGSKDEAYVQPTARPGSKRGFFRLEVVTDTQGLRHVIRPERKRRGRQQPPMMSLRRAANYRKQNTGAPLTGPQRSRLRKKQHQEIARRSA